VIKAIREVKAPPAVMVILAHLAQLVQQVTMEVQVQLETQVPLVLPVKTVVQAP